MVLKSQLKKGAKVTYYRHPNAEPQFGIVKRLNPYVENTVFVVYNWGEDEKKFEEYTAANTHFRNLELGWGN